MKILALEKSISNTAADDFKPHLKAEAYRAWELYQAGIIRELYFDQNHNAVIIMECDDIHDANGILQSLPLVKAGVITFEVIALNPYSGFSRLFS
ncbi:MAG TPA: superoxide dismutase [Bacillota bacterium]|nr:superoxide dismutase [Bacillota bacterium]